MKNWMKPSKLVFVILSVTLTVTNTAAFAQSTYGTDVAVNQTASTMCSSGEPVALTGNLHIQYSVTSVPLAGTRYEISMASSFSGTGQTTQTVYSGSGSYGYGFTTTDSPAQVTLQLSTPLGSKGDAPSLRLSQSVSITVDTSGSINASVISSSTDCAQ